MDAPYLNSPVFSIQAGFAKVIVLTRAEESDKVMVKFHPEQGAPSEWLVPLVVDGNPVTLTEAAPMTTLVLPGAYQVIPVGTLSPEARVSITDGAGFPVQLTVGVKNVAG